MENKHSLYVSFAVGLLVLMVAGIPFALFPLRGKLDDARTSRDNAMATKANVMADLQTLQDAQRSLDGVSEVKQAEYLNAIPYGVQQDILIKNINDLATKFGVTLSSVQFGLSDTLELPKRVSVSASFQSGYSDLLEFLKAIEANPRRIHVKTISVQIIPQASTSAVNFSLDMEAFYQGK